MGALKGRLHGGAPSEVRDQLTQIGDVEHAEIWIREALARGERLMGFGHRVYKTMDPRAAGAAAAWPSGWRPTPTGCSWRSTSRTSRCGCWPSTSPTGR